MLGYGRSQVLILGTKDRVQGDPVLPVPGEHTGFAMRQANCSQEEKKQTQRSQRNDSTGTGGLAGKSLPCNAGDVSSILGPGTKIPHSSGQ